MLVDDHTVLRAGLRLLINSRDDMEVVAEADNLRQVLSLVQTSKPDVVILDLTLPGGAALPLIGPITESEPAPRVLVLTMHNQAAYVRAAMAAGAGGYVVKTIPEQELLAAVLQVHRGRLVIDLDDEKSTKAVFAQLTGLSRPDLVSAPLSDREREVLNLLGKGHTNAEIALRLELSPKTVATYRARIGEKLGLKSTVDFVKYAADLGGDTD